MCGKVLSCDAKSERVQRLCVYTKMCLCLTSLQQHADSMRVIGQRGVVKRCAATETSSAAEPAAEFILSGHQDCMIGGGREKDVKGERLFL